MARQRRGHGEGMIRRRSDGRWEARMTTDGETRSLYGKTRQEARERLAQMQRDREMGLPRLDERQTVEQFLLSWLGTYEPTVAYDTWRRASQYVELHIIPVIGRVKLARLTPQQVQGLYADRLREGLSSSTVHHLHEVLHNALESAVQFGLVARNVSKLVDVPRMRRHEMRCYSPEEARRLLIVTEERGDRLHALYTLAISTGMRKGELLALRWRDVDLDAGVLRVRATLKRDKAGAWVWAEPKTRRSRRQVALSPVAVVAVRGHRLRQHEERLKLGAAWKDLDLVFPNLEGGLMVKSNLLFSSYKPLLKKAGLPSIRFHDLRHTLATLMFVQGIHPKVVSEMLGHASVSITLDLYSHVLPNMQREAVGRMDALLSDSDDAAPPDA